MTTKVLNYQTLVVWLLGLSPPPPYRVNELLGALERVGRAEDEGSVGRALSLPEHQRHQLLNILHGDTARQQPIIPTRNIFFFFFLKMFFGRRSPSFIYLIEITDTCCEIFIFILDSYVMATTIATCMHKLLSFYYYM